MDQIELRRRSHAQTIPRSIRHLSGTSEANHPVRPLVPITRSRRDPEGTALSVPSRRNCNSSVRTNRRPQINTSRADVPAARRTVRSKAPRQRTKSRRLDLSRKRRSPSSFCPAAGFDAGVIARSDVPKASSSNGVVTISLFPSSPHCVGSWLFWGEQPPFMPLGRGGR